MKIVHISFWEKQGGAAIAANRLHKAMLIAGVDSKMLVCERVSSDDTVFTVNTLKNKAILFILNAISSRLLAKFRPYVGNFSLSFWGLNLSDQALVKEADIVYIHWINNSFISLESIRSILKKKKYVIWFLHDMWPLTGGCHHSFDCIKYQSICKKCDLLGSRTKMDVSFKQFLSKRRKLMGFENLLIVCPSFWLSDCARKSILFGSNRIYTIPNLVNTEIFKPINKEYSRGILNLPLDKKLILFGADMGTDNPYKGWTYLKTAIGLIGSNCEIVTFGASCNIQREVRLLVHEFGKLQDSYSLVLLYSACDLFVIPSLAEAFGQTALESMACGTPVVGFDIGGIPDIIIHKKNGYLAKYKDAEDLANGILWISEKANINELSLNSREHAMKFDAKKVVKKHLSLLK